ncbi:hypothetical protein CONLIGDRAFT_673949 [Coniochaeta ligniaria NRRL 30616]|uniref:Uncharacterized protein n=1 Tax=Coniochaeta ligniaria NRRL 30616 TaxID=1408157 RepID=A0A1J7IRL6_9PEZI|nr:hypothetical protein CONLIGDRAFT_673949 [Coniochaeta ligniaria NRRL 30616]
MTGPASSITSSSIPTITSITLTTTQDSDKYVLTSTLSATKVSSTTETAGRTTFLPSAASTTAAPSPPPGAFSGSSTSSSATSSSSGFPPGFERLIPTTMRTLPPWARIETLTGGFTECTVITTTSPGATSPTIVPVIVPVGGPPLIYWGCVPFWPNNLEIRFPQFCIDILCFKIGICPRGDSGGGGGGGDGGQPTQSDKPTDKATSQSTTFPTSSKPSTACSVTVAATHESVFCSVTTQTSVSNESLSRRQGEQTECSTLAYHTVTRCSVVASSTTTTSTTTLEPPPRCTLDTCGSSTTRAAIRRDTGLIKQVNEPVPIRESQPQANTWADPANYGGDKSRFMRGETYLALLKPESRVDLSTPANAYNFVTFGNDVQTLAVSGLYGCTSVFVISRKGAWMSHFWENNFWFNPDSDDFKRYVLTTMDSGFPGSPKIQYSNQYAIGDLRKKDDKGDLGHMFDDVNKPTVFVLVPRRRVRLEDGSWSNAEDAGGGDLQYTDHLYKIIEKLEEIFPPTDELTDRVNCLDYAPMTQEEDGEDLSFATHRGKLLVQYQPAPKDCEGAEEASQPLARWRAFVQGGGDDQLHDEWVPGVGQQIQRRQSCPKGATTASSSSTTTGSSTTSRLSPPQTTSTTPSSAT